MITSPLRYPGGKAKLFPFMSSVLRSNELLGCDYCEPYAGGAGLAIRLLVSGMVRSISINDVDPSIFAFWKSVLLETDRFCSLINSTPLDIQEWYRQRSIWSAADTSNSLALGFAAYYLNRTNRSGIIEGAGPIGGYAQSGHWKIDARLVRDRQINNIKMLSAYARQISVTNYDAIEFLHQKFRLENSLIYADPPYFVKGSKLYKNFYNKSDHEYVRDVLASYDDKRWIVSYDDVEDVREIYSNYHPTFYKLNYSAGSKGVGSEVIFSSKSVSLPEFEGFMSAA